MNVAWQSIGEKEGPGNLVFFRCKVASAGDEKYLVCAPDAAGVVSCGNCSSYAFCKDRLCQCYVFHIVVADGIVMAA